MSFKPRKSSIFHTSILILSLLLIGGGSAKAFSNEENFEEYRESKVDLGVMKKEILAKSQISYRAQGVGPGLQSYGVIISCVDGRVSMLKTLIDPEIPQDSSQIREIGNLNPEVYMDLWSVLIQKGIWSMKDGPDPIENEPANFTVEFFASIADQKNSFKAKALYRPETSAYLSVQSVIDKTANMQTLWDSYHSLVRR